MMGTVPESTSKYKVLDLFSGIGGMSLGLERAGGFETAAFCEIDPFCRKVLTKHWPKVPIYDDIRTLSADRLRDDGIAVDLICGGFPCQDISVAGKGVGIGGERSGLWSEYARIIGEIRPRYIIVENVTALKRRGLDRVLGDLAALRYACSWECIPAAAIGAPHRRDRIWIVAYPSGKRCLEHLQRDSQEKQPTQQAPFRNNIDGCSTDVADPDGTGSQGWFGTVLPERAGECPAGKSGPQWIEDIWRVEPDVGRVVARFSPRVDGDLDANASQGGTGEILRALRNGIQPHELQWPVGGFGRLQTPEVLLASLCEYQGTPQPLGNVSLASAEASQVIMRGVWFDGATACPSCRRRAAEQRRDEHPDLVRLLSQLLACDCGSTWLDRAGTPSVASRVDRLRALGNAVVPQIPEILGRAIMSIEQDQWV